MLTVDAQVHAYERNHPGRPWGRHANRPGGGHGRPFLFNREPERPTEPNAGFLKYAPGASFPLHRHDFAQVWYIIEGEFSFAGKLYGPGTIAYMPDPHFEHEMQTATGGTIFFVQYPGSDDRCPADL